MASRTTIFLGGAAMLLTACGGTDLPTGQPRRDATIGDFDIPTASEAGTDGGAPAPDGAAPADAGNDGGMDAAVTPDAPTDAAADAAADLPPTPRFCGFNANTMNVFAVRYGLCSLQAPQAALNSYYRPDTWEGGQLALHSCGSLTCLTTSLTSNCPTILNTCLKQQVARAPGGECPPAACEGSPPRVSVRCRDAIVTRDDCMSVGRRCVAAGGEAACIPMAGDTCAAGAPARCNGSVLEQCLVGTYTPVRNCALTGGVCDAAGGTCRGAGPECATPGATECDGTQLRVCRGGRWHALDCGSLVSGASCQTVAGHAFCGVGTACDPTTAPANGTCDGATLVLCAGGQTFRFECTAHGFTGCGASGCTL